MGHYHDIRLPVRPLPIALGQAFAHCKPDHPALPAMNRIYVQLRPADQIACRRELLECQRAMRGETFATFAEASNARPL